MGSLPVDRSIELDPISDCEVFPPLSPLFGFAYTTPSTTLPLAGSIEIRLEPTADPEIARVRMMSYSNLAHMPFTLGGRSIDIVSMTPVTDDIEWNQVLTTKNVVGTYVVRYAITIDGSGPFELFEFAQLVATFDPATGAWSSITTSSTFDLTAIAIPTVSEWAAIVMAFLLVATGALYLRRTQSMATSPTPYHSGT